MIQKQRVPVILMAILMVSGLVLVAFNTPIAKAAGSQETPTYVNPYNATATPSADGALYHTVLEGQVPDTIARLYGVDLATLLENNNLDWNSIINIGDVLLIRKANERLPGELVFTATPPAGTSDSAAQSTGGAAAAEALGSLGGGASGITPPIGLVTGTAQAPIVIGEDGVVVGSANEEELENSVGLNYQQVQAQLIDQFSQNGVLVYLSGTPVPPELAMSASMNGDAYILLPDGQAGLRTATAVTAAGVGVLTIGVNNAQAIPAIQAVVLAPDSLKSEKSPAITPNLIERIFSDNTKYLALAIILMVLLGLLLLVLSTRRLRQ